ncbi:hypothetical protein Emin_1297 [Elusimicrobium minutum Pei191]|uniref:DUF4401 domain-containing protein n=1 Tax=Elusimicrobium minutum (strain Pei191) TaxID=445932 RepID=B2KEA1_ELUMP|nr:DUF4401 domain-containing protein [Elusimicrobium minutum]ACC98847.1 hypothetical protein Emin_1297 [Elusimicrobium minutum Pei191]
MINKDTVLEKIKPENKEAAKLVLSSDKQNLSLIIKIILGIGAFVSAIFFFLALTTVLVFSRSQGFAFAALGLIVMVCAVAAKLTVKNLSPGPRFFVDQLLLAAILFGKGCILFGILTHFERHRSYIIVDVGMITCFFLAAVPYKFFDSAADRFISVFTFMIFVYLKMFAFGGIWFSSNFVMLLSFIIGFFCFFLRKKDYYPIAWAMVLSMAIPAVCNIFIVYKAYSAYMSYSAVMLNVYKIILILFLSVMFALDAYLKGNLNKKTALILPVLLIFSLPFNLPVIYALALLVLGFYFSDLKIKILSYIILCGGIAYLYYSLHITLLAKSVLLLVSGLVLLALRELLKRYGYAR